MWTTSNTVGFTQAELDTINAVPVPVTWQVSTMVHAPS